MRLLCFVTAFLVGSLLSEARGSFIYSASQTQPQNVAGQDFTFNFASLPSSAGTSGSFFVHARGDYVHPNFAVDGESLVWDIDGLVSGGPVGRFLGSSTGQPVVVNDGVGGPFDFVLYSGGSSTIEFQRTYSLSAAQLSGILANGAASVFVDLGSNVNSGSFVEVGFSYLAVPEPASILLMLMAAVLLRLTTPQAFRYS